MMMRNERDLRRKAKGRAGRILACPPSLPPSLPASRMKVAEAAAGAVGDGGA